MQKIYPKICENLIGEENLREYIKKYRGLEIQYFDKCDEKLVDFIMAPAIEKVIALHPEIEEITIHPPVDNYNIEHIILADKGLFFKLLRDILELSQKYNIEINMILHSDLNNISLIRCLFDVLNEAARILKGSNVRILLENLYMYEGNNICAAVEICGKIDSQNIKVCIDMCHLYCRANMFKINIEEFLDQFLNKELCKKYVHQIHFADTKNDDGYIKRSTHGRTYDSIEKIKYDLDLLERYGMGEKIIVTEVSEEDYSTRKDQIKTIKLLEEVYKQ